MHHSPFTTLLLSALLLASPALAHPEPDIPVKSLFNKDGSAAISLELDPRCFAAEPITEPYTTKAQLDKMTDAQKKELLDKTTDLIKRSIDFLFEPGGKVEPEFALSFTGIAGAELKAPDDPVMIGGHWKTKIPAASTGYKLTATKEAKFAIIFRNYLEGVENPRFSVLFPGEISFVFDITSMAVK